jgi:hypothetical protein
LGDIKNYRENVSFILNKMNKAKIYQLHTWEVVNKNTWPKKLPTPIDRRLVMQILMLSELDLKIT